MIGCQQREVGVWTSDGKLCQTKLKNQIDNLRASIASICTYETTILISLHRIPSILSICANRSAVSKLNLFIGASSLCTFNCVLHKFMHHRAAAVIFFVRNAADCSGVADKSGISKFQTVDMSRRSPLWVWSDCWSGRCSAHWYLRDSRTPVYVSSLCCTCLFRNVRARIHRSNIHPMCTTWRERSPLSFAKEKWLVCEIVVAYRRMETTKKRMPHKERTQETRKKHKHRVQLWVVFINEDETHTCHRRFNGTPTDIYSIVSVFVFITQC